MNGKRDKIQKIFSSFNRNDITSYYVALNEIDKLSLKKEDFAEADRIKIAVLSSFTTGPIADFLKVSCLRLGLYADIYTSGFNQYFQEVFDENSTVYAFKPDIAFFLVDIRNELQDIFINPFSFSADHISDSVKSFTKKISDTINYYGTKAPYSIVVANNFVYTGRNGFGISDCKQESGLGRALRDINSVFADVAGGKDSVYIFAFDDFVREHGYKNICDSKMRHIASMSISEEGLMLLSLEYMKYIYALKGFTKKCLVVDLDNTLWGGIVAEDGFAGIALGENEQGRIYSEFQKAIKNLLSKGVLLAVNSKNNFDDAMEVIRKHPHMILKEEDFSAVRINWENKADNISSIAAELNIGPDSIVFLDDNPRERALVKKSLPGVTVPELPADCAKYTDFLQAMPEFEILSLTKEDRQRADMYKAQKRRETFHKRSVNMEEFIKGLDMKIEIKKAGDYERPRAAQLFAKTNQFNLTTKRYSEGEVEGFIKSDKHKLFCADIKDRFGDNGISALMLLEVSHDILKIDSFLLSCRVIGRRVEQAMLIKIFKEAIRCGLKKVQGCYIKTKKNMPTEDFYKNNGFVLISGDDNNQVWEFDIDYSKNYDFPDWAEIVEK